MFLLILSASVLNGYAKYHKTKNKTLWEQLMAPTSRQILNYIK